MRPGIGTDLILVNSATAVLALSVFLAPAGVARVVLGLPALLFFPGYALVAALHPRRSSISGVGRVALSLGLSFAVVSLIGLALNYTPWGLTQAAVLWSNVAFILGMSLVAWARRRRYAEGERFDIRLRLRMPTWGDSGWGRALSVLLAASLVAAVATAAWAMARPKARQQFTEFYVLGARGMAADYPVEFTPGDEIDVTVGIINREQETASYRLVMTLDGVEIERWGPIVLANGEKWEQPVAFRPQAAPGEQKLEFHLYLGTDTEPHLEPLRLWIRSRSDTGGG